MRIFGSIDNLVNELWSDDHVTDRAKLLFFDELLSSFALIRTLVIKIHALSSSVGNLGSTIKFKLW